jgi:hypothetical protein
MVQLVPAAVHVAVPGEAVTVYPVMGEPLSDGAVQLMVASAVPP